MIVTISGPSGSALVHSRHGHAWALRYLRHRSPSLLLCRVLRVGWKQAENAGSVSRFISGTNWLSSKLEL